jgi:hypothetical protein
MVHRDSRILQEELIIARILLQEFLNIMDLACSKIKKMLLVSLILLLLSIVMQEKYPNNSKNTTLMFLF